MSLKAWTNISGTTAPSFTIGKGGATIHQGTTVPDPAVGSTGDLYVRHGSSAGLFQKEAGGWKATNSSFVRQQVGRGSTTAINDVATYVAVIAGTTGTTTLSLPTGQIGKQITIKDEVGAGSVLILGVIDGVTNYTISAAKGSVTLLWAGAWMIVRQA